MIYFINKLEFNDQKYQSNLTVKIITIRESSYFSLVNFCRSEFIVNQCFIYQPYS